MEIHVSKRNETTLTIKFFTFNKEGVAKIRSIPGRRWIQEELIWTVPYTLDALQQLIEALYDCKWEVEPQLMKECQLLQTSLKDSHTSLMPNVLEWESSQRKRMRDELLARGYSSKTIKAYLGQIDRFYVYMKDQGSCWNDQTLGKYSLHLLHHHCSHAYVNQAISAVKFYSVKVLKLHSKAAYIRPKREQKLPIVLSLQEVKLILQAVQNMKHKAILYLTYSSGLRVSEIVRLQLRDIDMERKTLHVRQGKGRKDRYTIVSDAAMDILLRYYQQEKPQKWIFPGQTKGTHLTERSVQKIFE